MNCALTERNWSSQFLYGRRMTVSEKMATLTMSPTRMRTNEKALGMSRRTDVRKSLRQTSSSSHHRNSGRYSPCKNNVALERAFGRWWRIAERTFHSSHAKRAKVPIGQRKTKLIERPLTVS